MMPLAAHVLALFLHWHSNAPPEDLARFESMAEAIAEASEAAPLWQTKDNVGTLATAAVLASVAEHESGLTLAVQRCEKRGDHGRSIGAFQLMRGGWQGHSLSEVCESDTLQASLALGVLHAIFDRPHSFLFTIRAYASGHGKKDTRAAREIQALSWRAFQMSNLRWGKNALPESVEE